MLDEYSIEFPISEYVTTITKLETGQKTAENGVMLQQIEKWVRISLRKAMQVPSP
jgi:hypothetical protein